MSIEILPKNIHPSWHKFLSDDILNELRNIESQIGSNYNPPTNLVLRFLENDLYNIKIVILGMDPYPQFGVAIGRCFQVGGHTSWNQPFNKSLQNIIKLIHKSYSDIIDYGDIKSLGEIRKEIQSDDFDILSPDTMFDSWENQGVLLLNAYLTVEIGKPGSHSDIWDTFSKKLIRFIDAERPDAKWFLWGNDAQEIGTIVINGVKYKDRHPSRVSEKYDKDFLKSNCFKETMNIINWLGE
ncbi:uracil-DNA glycosylase [Alkaliphilus sp. B6464]|uniref:uracil-DNA glycosylase n=1 Tax=Alkaliphilus sp. B6464 TaxID=2731219 RepID=UPI001BAA818D|nr:uracil-DNA glycosylase [Alkaliphilus sp. B6464]QUH21853.1 uracil-DNA glycosylase [Alkaliphilus sp. B6464]